MHELEDLEEEDSLSDIDEEEARDLLEPHMLDVARKSIAKLFMYVGETYRLLFAYVRCFYSIIRNFALLKNAAFSSSGGLVIKLFIAGDFNAYYCMAYSFRRFM